MQDQRYKALRRQKQHDRSLEIKPGKQSPFITAPLRSSCRHHSNPTARRKARTPTSSSRSRVETIGAGIARPVATGLLSPRYSASILAF